MNGKLASKIFFWKLILCTEGENDAMGTPDWKKLYVNENLLIALMHNFKRNSELLVANALKG